LSYLTFEGFDTFYFEVDLICLELLTEFLRDFGIVILGILSFESVFSALDAYFSLRGGFLKSLVSFSFEIELGFLIFFIFCMFFLSLHVSNENLGLLFLEDECCLMVMSSYEDSRGRVSRESFP